MPQERSNRGTSVAASDTDSLVDAVPYAKLKPGPSGSASSVVCHQLARIHRAMVEIVAEQGYEAVTVRGLARVAGVSTRTFYEHYQGKQDCFWSVHQLLVRRILQQIAVGDTKISSDRERIWNVLDAILQDWISDPDAAWLVLVQAYVAGPEALTQTQSMRSALEARISEATSGMSNPPSHFLLEWIVAALIGAARSCLLRNEPLSALRPDLASWTSMQIRSEGKVSIPSAPARGERGEKEVRLIASPSEDAHLVLAAISKLAATKDLQAITPDAVCAAAGVSSRRFYASFPSLESAFVAAAEMHQETVISNISERCASVSTPTVRAGVVVAELCAWGRENAEFFSLSFHRGPGTGMLALRSRDRFAAKFSSLLLDQIPEPSSSDRLVRLSVDALWEIFGAAGNGWRSRQISRFEERLAYLFLAPISNARAPESVIPERVPTAA